MGEGKDKGYTPKIEFLGDIWAVSCPDCGGNVILISDQTWGCQGCDQRGTKLGWMEWMYEIDSGVGKDAMYALRCLSMEECGDECL